jgi:hypothetical protein
MENKTAVDNVVKADVARLEKEAGDDITIDSVNLVVDGGKGTVGAIVRAHRSENEVRTIDFIVTNESTANKEWFDGICRAVKVGDELQVTVLMPRQEPTNSIRELLFASLDEAKLDYPDIIEFDKHGNLMAEDQNQE